MTIKVILVIAMIGFHAGAIDHIEFETLNQCLAAKQQLEKHQYGLTTHYGYYCDCIEVSE